MTYPEKVNKLKKNRITANYCEALYNIELAELRLKMQKEQFVFNFNSESVIMYTNHLTGEEIKDFDKRLKSEILRFSNSSKIEFINIDKQ